MSWKPDNSGLVAITGNKVSFTGGNGGGDSKGNALWVDGEGGPGEWLWKIEKGSGMWIGVAEEARFGPGYQLKGLLYGGPGNLSDGSSLVTGHWGPKFATGDNVGMKVEVVDGSTVVSFRHNDTALGAAFSISGWTGDKIRPVVSLGSSGQVVSIQASSGASFAKVDGPRVGLEGDWQGEDLKVSIEADNDTGKWSLAATVGNCMSCEVVQDGDKFTSGPVRSSRMMAPPHLQAKETAVGKLLEELISITREGENLRLSSPNNSFLLSAAAGPGPATRERVNWLK